MNAYSPLHFFLLGRPAVQLAFSNNKRIKYRAQCQASSKAVSLKTDAEYAPKALSFRDADSKTQTGAAERQPMRAADKRVPVLQPRSPPGGKTRKTSRLPRFAC